MNEENSLESVEAVLAAPGKGMGGSTPVGSAPGAGSTVADSVFGGQKPSYGFDLGSGMQGAPRTAVAPTLPKSLGETKTGLSALRENLKQTLYDAGQKVFRFGRDLTGGGRQQGMGVQFGAGQQGARPVEKVAYALGLESPPAAMQQETTVKPAAPKIGGAFAQSIGLEALKGNGPDGQDWPAYMYGGVGINVPDYIDINNDDELRAYVEENNRIVDTFNKLYMED